jgi:hypothetical protein
MAILRAEQPWFYPRQGQEIFILTAVFIRTLWLAQPPARWVPVMFLWGVRRTRREADYLTLCNAEGSEELRGTSIPPHAMSRVLQYFILILTTHGQLQN